MIMNHANYTGWDIGGAHLKFASMNAEGVVGVVRQYATPLWQGLESLSDVMPGALQTLAEGENYHAVTMTAELVDIFPDRISGIAEIMRLCETLLRPAASQLRYYSASAGLVDNASANNETASIGSANWHASTQFVSTHVDAGIFIDAGSTTTDIIPFFDQRPQMRGHNDQARLQHDELVYTGVTRTPLMAITRRVPFQGQWQSLAAEHFAVTADIYRILGWLAADADLMPTTDGCANDASASIVRLARMLGTDAACYPENENVWQQLASFLVECQLNQLFRAVSRVLSRYPALPHRIVGAGVGTFLVERLAKRMDFEFQAFSGLTHCHEKQHEYCNRCAPAIAVADINRRRLLS